MPLMTTSELIEKFGGTSRTAALFGVGPSAVSNWKSDGQFPPRLHLRVLREAKRHGIDLPDDFFDKASAA